MEIHKTKNDKMTYLQLLGRVAQIDKISRVVPFLIAGHMCSIKLKLFRSALCMGKIMRDPAPLIAHGRKTLQMCGSKIIPAFDLKGFMLVLGNIIRPCQLRYTVDFNSV